MVHSHQGWTVSTGLLSPAGPLPLPSVSIDLSIFRWRGLGQDRNKPEGTGAQEVHMLTQDHVLSNDLLTKFAERCAVYDRENRFFSEDFADLKAAGYLTMNVPAELGGRGFTLAQSCREQRRLAYYAPATALG